MKSKHVGLFVLAVSALTALGVSFPTESFAAVSHSSTVLYFDANDNIIGQQIRWCNNVAHHAGVIDSQNQYQIEFEASCSYSNPDFELQITYFHSATGKSIHYYCDEYHAVGTPFYGAPDCKLVPPRQDMNLAPFENGWQ